VLDSRSLRGLVLIALGSLTLALESACGGSHTAAPLTPALAETSRQLASFASQGGLDCNGLSPIQRTFKHMFCADLLGDEGRGEDNGVYIGHDEPSMAFNSDAPHSGNAMQWTFKLPVERALPATQTFENEGAIWLSLALCDPNSYPQNACIADSDANDDGTFDPKSAGSAVLELQFYPPGFPPFVTQISCDLTHWCAALNIDSLECTSGFSFCNPNCTEPFNFAFIQEDGIPTGPPGPASQTANTATPNAKTLLMNQGDTIRVTITDTPSGMINRVEDLTSGRSGFMVASGVNGFQTSNLQTCAPQPLDFHPEFATAKVRNSVPWAALTLNVNFATEIGHFTPGLNGDGDGDDAPCFAGPTLPGCLDFAAGDLDFDGSSYTPDWPDGTKKAPDPILIGSVTGTSAGPVSSLNGISGFTMPYKTVQFETDIGGSESTCTPTGAGCVLPPSGAAFYPFYSREASHGRCLLTFGNDIAGKTQSDFGKDAQYGAPNVAVYYGQFSSGPTSNPCA
jgi:hypothetical protein